MTPEEMIERYQIRLVGVDKIAVPNPSRLSPAEKAQIQGAKSEILQVFRRRADDEKAARDAERQAIMNGTQLIQLSWYDGSPLSGWMVDGLAGEMLVELGIASKVSGWGINVPDHVVQALGTEFSYPDALEYTRPAREEADAKRAEREAARAEAFKQARETGKPVELSRHVVECDGTVIGCSVDVVIVYALPNGSTCEERTHTY